MSLKFIHHILALNYLYIYYIFIFYLAFNLQPILKIFDFVKVVFPYILILFFFVYLL